MNSKGSVTVFCALSMMLVASFLFALVEAGRVSLSDAYADMTSELALESVCAEYQPALWEDYRLLCLDGAYGGETFSAEYAGSAIEQRIRKNIETEGLQGNLLALQLEKAEVEEYQLLTDGEGKVFLNRIADYMQENLSLEAAELLYEKYKQGEELEKEASVEGSIENAQEAIIEARKNQEKEMDSSDEGEVSKGAEMPQGERKAGKTEPSEAAEIKENPLEIALQLKQNAVLGMVVEDVAALSAKQIHLADGLCSRKCQVGNAGAAAESGWYERVLVLEYLDKYYADYTSPGKQALSYEMEYVLCGKDADKDNLESVVNRMLLLREAANVIHILRDEAKRNEAEILANALAGFTANPAIIKIVEIGIVAAWAYMESIQDVRALLQGDKIALVKSGEQWTIHVSNLLESFQASAKAKNCENGLSYQSYLKLLLFGQKERLLAYRMMDVMEQNMRLRPRQENCRMDHMICRLTCRMEYQSAMIFLKSQVLENTKRKQFSYY